MEYRIVPTNVPAKNDDTNEPVEMRMLVLRYRVSSNTNWENLLSVPSEYGNQAEKELILELMQYVRQLKAAELNLRAHGTISQETVLKTLGFSGGSIL